MLITARDTQDFFRSGQARDFQPARQSATRDGWDRFAEAWKSSRFENLSNSRSRALYDEYEKELEHIERLTGERLDNPEGLGREMPIPDPLELGADAISNAIFGHDWVLSQHMKYDARVNYFDDQVEKLKEKHLGLKVRSRDDFMKAIGEKAKSLRDKQKTGVNIGFAGTGAFFGDIAAVTSDPVNLASMAFGGAGAVRGAVMTLSARLANISKVAITEGAIGMAAEAAIQPQVFDFKQEIDSPYDVSDAVNNILMAGFGGAALTGATVGAGQAFNGILNRWRKSKLPNDAASQAAEKVLDAHQNATRNPFPQGMEFEIAHAKIMDEATAAAIYGKSFEGKALDALRTSQNDKIGRLITHVLNNRATRNERNYGNGVTYAKAMPGRIEELQAIFKRDLKKKANMENAVHHINEFGVTHVLDKHATDAIPLRPDDLEHIPDVTQSGEIVGIKPTDKGLSSVEYRQEIDGNWLHVVEEIRSPKGQTATFVLKTAYWKPGKKTKTGSKDPASSAPERLDASKQSNKPDPVFSADSPIDPSPSKSETEDGIKRRDNRHGQTTVDSITHPDLEGNRPTHSVSGDGLKEAFDQMDEAFSTIEDMNNAELERIIGDQGDFDVPIESVEMDGQMTTRSVSAKELMAKADEEILAVEALKACITGKG